METSKQILDQIMKRGISLLLLSDGVAETDGPVLATNFSVVKDISN